MHIWVGFIWVRQSSLWFNKGQGFCCINMLDLLSVRLDIATVVLFIVAIQSN